MARKRSGRDRHPKQGVGRLDPDRAAEPASRPTGPASVAAGRDALDARLRATVSAASLTEAPVTAVDRIQSAAPAQAYTLAPAQPEGAGEALRPAAVPNDPAPRIAPQPAPEAVRAGPPGVEAIGATLMAYMQGETIAALSHLHALGAARSPTEAIRLQFDEMRRATDATLTCWSRLARDATRLIAPR